MHSIFDYIVSPVESRYNNEVKVGDKELIVNTEIFNHQFVNREATVLSTPIATPTPVNPGDKVLIHHNVFRRWHDVRGIEKNSSSYISDDKYSCTPDQVYAYKKDESWQALPGYCFVKPIKNKDKFATSSENELIGFLLYDNRQLNELGVKAGDLVGIGKFSQFEFIINGERVYRAKTNDISVKYEYTGDQEEYNPSWANSSSRVN
jgi:co-chaperonin GroES (HSP10)